MSYSAPVRTVHAKEPDQVILDEIGDLSGHEVLYQNVLVAVYERKEGMTAGGIIAPAKVFEEDQYQSKVGMVLKVGPRAFQDEGSIKFHDYAAKPGDWVVYKASNAMALLIGVRKCHLIADVYLTKMRIAHPDLVY